MEKLFGFDIKVDDNIPANELWFVNNGKVIGKIINIGNDAEKATAPSERTGDSSNQKCANCNKCRIVYECNLNAEPDSNYCHKVRTLKAGT